MIPQGAGTRGSRRLHELEAAAGPIAQTAVAAGVSWWIATDLPHHTTPLFAPISAIMVVGVSLGVLVGDALIDAAVLLGGGALLASQAATSSVLVAALLPSSYGLPPPRLIDTLVGGGVGLLVLAAAPGNPTRLARRTGRAIDLEPALPQGLSGSVRLLAEAARALFAQLLADAPAARETGLLLDAAGLATHALDAGASPPAHLAGQVRSIALDLLVAAGVPANEAAQSVRRAGVAPTP